ncbi:hypothetical protein L596_016120 [Steinernema carpocapsae]|uniref:Uncharacterized protein n=1 Tax=Steinernema carpocapsae TaxID=34508 RepID=A0A4U5NHV2_STECR|nr:hypothetical protein L596_016120 [Steinernema carpocapsae]
MNISAVLYYFPRSAQSWFQSALNSVFADDENISEITVSEFRLILLCSLLCCPLALPCTADRSMCCGSNFVFCFLIGISALAPSSWDSCYGRLMPKNLYFWVQSEALLRAIPKVIKRCPLVILRDKFFPPLVCFLCAMASELTSSASPSSSYFWMAAR